MFRSREAHVGSDACGLHQFLLPWGMVRRFSNGFDIMVIHNGKYNNLVI